MSQHGNIADSEDFVVVNLLKDKIQEIIMEDEAEDVITDEVVAARFKENAVRNAFCMKVFLILSLQFSLSFAVVAAFIYIKELNKWLSTNMELVFIAIVLQGLISSADLLPHNVLNTRKEPVNYILLVLFSINQSIYYGFANIALDSKTIRDNVGVPAKTNPNGVVVSENTIWVGVGVSAVSCFLLAILGHRIFLNTIGKCVYIASNVSALAGLVILYFFFEAYRLLLFGFLFAILMVNYLNYNLHRIMDGKLKNPIQPEDYIMAAIHVYLVILEIFNEIIEELLLAKIEIEEEKQNTIPEGVEIETTTKEK